MMLFGLFLMAGAVLITMAGRREKGPWRYRGICRLRKEVMKKGWPIPEWMKESMIFRTWVLLLAGSMLMAVGAASDTLGADGPIVRLKRPEYGRGSVQEELALEWQEKNGAGRKEEILVEVEEKNPTKKEAEEILRQVKEKLDEVVPGENSSLDKVNQPLCLPEELEGFPVSINWSTDHPEAVDWEGKLGNEISEKGEHVCVTGVIQLGEREEEYRIQVKVFPPLLSPEERLQSMLRESNQNTEESWMRLPEQIDGRNVIWRKSSKDTARGIVLLVFLCPVLLLVRDRQAARERKKREQQQMLQDYPEILSKLTLLLSAGVNLRRAMERIGKDYVNYKRREGERKAYEMILEACEEMNRGRSEKEAYEKLGERCSVLCYRTLSALLVQHLQKGNRSMERMLGEEVRKAQEIRRQQARVLGEQASTKLLIPMILMLLVVFVILMVPAWLTFAA